MFDKLQPVEPDDKLKFVGLFCAILREFWKRPVRADLLALLKEIMKRTVVLLAAALLLVASGIYAFGDIARPKPSPAQEKSVLYTGLTVVSDSKGGYEARLQISQELIKRLQEKAANNGGTTSFTQQVLHSSPRTIMAGLF